MRILHLPVSYLPWTVGGKEVYTHSLARELARLGQEQRIAIHQGPATEPLGTTEHKSIPVCVLPPLPGVNLRRAVYACKTASTPGFEELLREFRPEVVHFHDFSVGANLTHLEAAKKSGARVLMTIHSPGQICLQRELLYRKQQVCDGEILASRCTECRLNTSGVPFAAAEVLARLRLPRLDVESRNPILRAVTGRLMTDLFREAWVEMLTNVDRIQALAAWVTTVLLRNGAAKQKISFIRSGFPRSSEVPRDRIPRDDTILRVVFVGRCDWIKGPQVIAKALQDLSCDTRLRVDFFGPYWDGVLGREILQGLGTDSRVGGFRLIPNENVQQLLREYDVTVVPSLGLETGPLTVLESFAAGTPVVGSNLGGIAEAVRDGVDGILFPPGDSQTLASILRKLMTDPSLLQRLRENVRAPRSMAEVAMDTLGLYEQMLGATRDNARPRTDFH